MTDEIQRDWRYPGARWWKFDFHTHTPASTDYGKGTDQQALRNVTPEEWLLGFMRADIDCVSVTDHNSGEWIDRLKAALTELEQQAHPEFRPLHLFPGVEITANGGTHILAILDLDKTSADVAALLGATQFHGARGASDAAANASPIQVIDAIVEAGGIPIPAHVDGPAGLWQVGGNTLAPLLDAEGLFAIEVVDRGLDKPALYRQKKLAWAEVMGSDSHHPSGESGSHFPGSHYTWVKMATPSLEGLRLALMDGERFSIRRSDDPDDFDPFALPEHFVEGIEINEARYIGRGQSAKLKFSPWFNALIGGRGTGKSTVVHLVRRVYRRDNEMNHLDASSEPRLTFERFNQVPRNRDGEGGLQDTTSAMLTLMRDGVRHFLNWRYDDSGVIVEEAAEGGRQASGSQSVTPERFPVRIFSQGQIAALAGEGQQALLHIIDEAAGTATQQVALEEARRKFLALRAQVRELDGQLAGRDALTVQLEDVKRKLQRFEEAHHAEVLKAYQRRNRQRREIDRQFETAASAVQRIEQMTEDLQVEDLPAELFDTTSTEDQEALAVVNAMADAQHRAAGTIREAARALRVVVDAQRIELEKSAWKMAVDNAAGDYQQLVETLKAQGVSDPSEYGRLVQERQRLDGELKRLDSLQARRTALTDEAKGQLETVWAARRALSEVRQDFLLSALTQNLFVRIELVPYGRDPSSAERSLREVLGAAEGKYKDIYVPADGDRSETGLIADLYEGVPAETTAATDALETRLRSLHERLVSAAVGQGNFGAWFNKFLEGEAGTRPELIDRCTAWFPEDSLQVEYSRRGDGRDFQPITQASAGQKAAAMLAFLLAHGTEPLILDQPEDDLDNHLIYDLVVRQIRANKLRRQIIVVTHNPNIVVNGDAEMLYALKFSNGQCRVAQSGSLQEQAMRKEVCDVMEGGTEAFERRYRRLGGR